MYHLDYSGHPSAPLRFLEHKDAVEKSVEVHFIRWIAIYPLDNVIRSLNNQALEDRIRRRHIADPHPTPILSSFCRVNASINGFPEV